MIGSNGCPKLSCFLSEMIGSNGCPFFYHFPSSFVQFFCKLFNSHILPLIELARRYPLCRVASLIRGGRSPRGRHGLAGLAGRYWHLSGLRWLPRKSHTLHVLTLWHHLVFVKLQGPGNSL